jgi:hypothetical protein
MKPINLHNLVKASLPELKSVISDHEILATNRINRTVGEVAFVDGILSLFKETQKLNIQDYELLNNIPSFLVSILARRKKIKLLSYSKGTALWANIIAVYLVSNKKLDSLFMYRDISLEPNSIFAEKIMAEINSVKVLDSDPKLEAQNIIVVDALDDLIWNRSLELFYQGNDITAIIIKNYNRAGVYEETTISAPKKILISQSVVGYGFIYRT